MTTPDYRLSQLETLEAESIHVIREVVAELERPVLLFSGGKDSIVMLELARKAFAPARIPFPVMHVDTGLNFPDVLEFRDKRVAELGVQLIVASVPDAIAAGTVKEEPNGSRNRIQTPVLLDAVEEHGFTALFGGARRDEDKARAKERVFSFRDEFGQWDPKNQRPEIWDLYNGRIHLGESIRVFPLSNWTELDIWQYIAREQIAIPALYLAAERDVVERQGMLYAVNEFIRPRDGRAGAPRDRALPHRRRREPDRRRPVGGHHRRRGHRRDRGDPHDRARRHPRRRQGQRRRHGGPEEGGLLLMAVPLHSPPSPRPPHDLAVARKDILRIATAGSVDDGKSTLIGRLLYDSKAIFEDQYEAVERASKGDYVDLALLTDGLRAEREQGITIDVAYRYFSTPRRTFILADTPGHVQYTRNMVTGASTADLAIVLVDARKGMLEQSRRHAFLASLLRVPHLVVAVNKMDLVDWSEATYEAIRDEFTAFAAKLDIPDLTVVPISALQGDNVVTRSANTPWYEGPSLLHHLEHVHVASDRNLVDVRFPVQYVIRPQSDAHHDYRGYAGTVASGVLRARRRGAGAAQRPDHDDRRRSTAPAARSTRRSRRWRSPSGSTDDVDVSRGDLICRPANAPRVTQDVDALVCWMADEPLRPRQRLAIKHTTRTVRGHGQGAAVPARRQHAAPRPGRRRARPQRHRPGAAAHHPAAVRRRLRAQPGHRPVHPHRRGDQRHRRRRDAHPGRLR